MSSVERLPLLDRALAVRCLADERARARVLERSGDDLAGGGRALVDQDDELDRGSVATPPGSASGATWRPSASCCQKIGPEAMNWLAIVRAAVTKPPGVAAQVEDDGRLAGRDVGRERRVELGWPRCR